MRPGERVVLLRGGVPTAEEPTHGEVKLIFGLLEVKKVVLGGLVKFMVSGSMLDGWFCTLNFFIQSVNKKIYILKSCYDM